MSIFFAVEMLLIVERLRAYAIIGADSIGATVQLVQVYSMGHKTCPSTYNCDYKSVTNFLYNLISL